MHTLLCTNTHRHTLIHTNTHRHTPVDPCPSPPAAGPGRFGPSEGCGSRPGLAPRGGRRAPPGGPARPRAAGAPRTQRGRSPRPFCRAPRLQPGCFNLGARTGSGLELSGPAEAGRAAAIAPLRASPQRVAGPNASVLRSGFQGRLCVLAGPDLRYVKMMRGQKG